MRTYPNIEKSGFPTADKPYVGYCDGAWNIYRRAYGWMAVSQVNRQLVITGATLAEISAKLTKGFF